MSAIGTQLNRLHVKPIYQDAFDSIEKEVRNWARQVEDLTSANAQLTSSQERIDEFGKIRDLGAGISEVFHTFKSTSKPLEKEAKNLLSDYYVIGVYQQMANQEEHLEGLIVLQSSLTPSASQSSASTNSLFIKSLVSHPKNLGVQPNQNRPDEVNDVERVLIEEAKRVGCDLGYQKLKVVSLDTAKSLFEKQGFLKPIPYLSGYEFNLISNP